MTTVAEGMVASRQIKSEWLSRLRAGTATFPELVEASRGPCPGRYLTELKLVTLLTDRPGWTQATAEAALREAGLAGRTVQSVRRSPALVAQVEELLTAERPSRYRERPTRPAGWPFSGRLDVLRGEDGGCPACGRRGGHEDGNVTPTQPPRRPAAVPVADGALDPLARLLDDEDDDAGSEEAGGDPLLALLNGEDDE